MIKLFKIATALKIYTVMKKAFVYLKKNYILIMVVMLITGLFDLWTLPAFDFGSGFVLAFLMAFGGIIYKISKK